MIDGFLLGIIAATSVTAGVFFLKFWKVTRDTLFLALAIAFVIEGLIRVGVLFASEPNEASPWIYIVRLFSYALILAAILKKNFGRNR